MQISRKSESELKFYSHLEECVVLQLLGFVAGTDGEFLHFVDGACQVGLVFQAQLTADDFQVAQRVHFAWKNIFEI